MFKIETKKQKTNFKKKNQQKNVTDYDV